MTTASGNPNGRLLLPTAELLAAGDEELPLALADPAGLNPNDEAASGRPKPVNAAAAELLAADEGFDIRESV